MKPTLLYLIRALAATGLALSLAAGQAGAATVELSGVKLEDSADLKGGKAVLNGAGIRYKAIFKVYVAGLYAGKKFSSLEELVAIPGAKRMSITMLREIDANELGKLFTRGVQDNSPKAEMSKLVPGLIKMGQMFADQKKMAPGDTIVMDWVPDVGMTVTVRGKVQGEPFKEVEFFNAMMGIWLGPAPADFKLKEALLGIKPS